MAPSQFGMFTKSGPDRETPDLEYHVQPLSTDRLGDPLHRFSAITVSVCNLRPTSVGHVHATTPGPRSSPRFASNYLSTEEDRRVAVTSIRQARQIMTAQALERYAPEEWLPGPGFQTDDALAAKAGDIATTIFHPVGTCRMGTDERAVVDCCPEGARHGGAAHRRRLGHAAHRFGQYRFSSRHDRRARGRSDRGKGLKTGIDATAPRRRLAGALSRASPIVSPFVAKAKLMAPAVQVSAERTSAFSAGQDCQRACFGLSSGHDVRTAFLRR